MLAEVLPGKGSGEVGHVVGDVEVVTAAAAGGTTGLGGRARHPGLSEIMEDLVG